MREPTRGFYCCSSHDPASHADNDSEIKEFSIYGRWYMAVGISSSHISFGRHYAVLSFLNRVMNLRKNESYGVPLNLIFSILFTSRPELCQNPLTLHSSFTTRTGPQPQTLSLISASYLHSKSSGSSHFQQYGDISRAEAPAIDANRDFGGDLLLPLSTLFEGALH